MQFEEAQQDMRAAYAGGSTGILSSALAWCAAAVAAAGPEPRHAVPTLFVAGFFIYPLSVLLSKLIGRRGAHAKGNPLGALALESTALLLLGLPIAYGVSLYRLELFFPAMMLLIGGRYLVFATLYGLRLYWALGAALALGAYALAALHAPVQAGAIAGAALEAVFAAAVFVTDRSLSPSPSKAVA